MRALNNNNIIAISNYDKQISDILEKKGEGKLQYNLDSGIAFIQSVNKAYQVVIAANFGRKGSAFMAWAARILAFHLDHISQMKQ
ncbi:hypothetical protein HYALB_00004953 [Hymenoscyphus albidus]|uniref:Uncharacterized protein n=1 Tax=Hymenoscyphus albidus TaxID=595503 RepID=A0A9N9LG73_9HELO|nr:hypothetical protein HYALB_00004953 [Hymenoscyphus albidus]